MMALPNFITLSLASSPSSSPATGKESFTYDRAAPHIRWSEWHKQEVKVSDPSGHSHEAEDPFVRLNRLSSCATDENSAKHSSDVGKGLPVKSDYVEQAGRKKRGRLSRLALLKATDWRERVDRLCTAICKLPVTRSVADLLSEWEEKLAPTDYCFVVKQVGQRGQWGRAMELFEWLNMEHWYTPNNRMLSAILGVLGRAGQVGVAEEVFQRVEPELGDCVQVFNAMLSVHARQGNWGRMQEVLKMMLEKGCERDLVTYNTLISGRAKAGLHPGMGMDLLKEIWQAGLRPDTVTYNTLISMCSLNKCYEDAVKVYEEMQEQGCQADLWTYNSMIMVYGRCGLDQTAEEVYLTIEEEGFKPDAITYNSILFAFAKKGRMEDVDLVRRQMQEVGCDEDVITLNTIIDMYGKRHVPEKALAIYEEMKTGKSKPPDMVTFVVLIDGLGKAGEVEKAKLVFEEMVEAKFKPSLHVYSAMICAYSKAGMYQEAVTMYQSMQEAGIQMDGLAYSVMLDVFLNLGQPSKVLAIYKGMMSKQKPGLVQCELMLRLFKEEGLNSELEILSESIHQFGFDPVELCICLARVGLCDAAEKAFKTAISRGKTVDTGTRDLLLAAYIKGQRFKDAQSLVKSITAPGLEEFQEQLVVNLANAEKFEEAEEELVNLRVSGRLVTVNVFQAFIVSYEQAGMWKESVQKLKEMEDSGLLPDALCNRSGLLAYCRLDRPDQGWLLLQRIVSDLGGVTDATLHLALVKAFLKREQWNEAGIAFAELKQTGVPISLKDYNSLLLAYAQNGQTHHLQDLLQRMAEDGLAPSSGSVVALFEALLMAGRLVDVDALFKRLQEMGVKPNLQTRILLVKAYAKSGTVEKANSLYEQLRSEGYVLHVEVYNVLIGMYSKAGSVDGAERTMKELTESGFQPNVFCYNAMLSVYGKVKNFKKAAAVFQGMQIVGCTPDTVTYNTLIHLYSRCLHTQEAYFFLQEMKKAGCVPDLASYTLLISAYGQLQMWEAAGNLFKEARDSGIQILESTYHLMLDIYRRAGRPELTQEIVSEMEEKGFESTAATMHMVMDSFGKSGQTEGASAVFDRMVEAGVSIDVSHYTSLIDAYLKEDDYNAAISKLKEMESEGIKANFVTWTCVIGAASKCEQRQDALLLLRALRDIGLPLPLRLLTGKDPSVLGELNVLLDSLQDERVGAVSGLVNVILDLLWAFQMRATAAKVFHLATEKKTYEREFSRVEEQDWGADLCKLSPGGALVALTLWLLQMQDAALQGTPASSKSVLLIVGSSKRTNHISICKTVKAQFWEMGAPFLLSKTRDGVFISKGHSVRMWLKDSPKCLHLELKDWPALPELNSMQVFGGAWMARAMVPIFKQIEETMGTTIQPKKFMRLANMHDLKRTDVMAADIQGRAEKAAKDELRRQKKAMVTLPHRKSLSNLK